MVRSAIVLLLIAIVIAVRSAGGDAPQAAAITATYTATPSDTPTPTPTPKRNCEAGPLIPDNNKAGLTTCVDINNGSTITDLDVEITIKHTWVGDLIVMLTHEETETVIRLIDRPGSPPGLGCSSDNITVTLSDEAPLPVESQCSMAAPAINGTFRPNEPLSTFDGELAGGTWKLTVIDAAGFSTGTLNGWAPVFTKGGTPQLTATPTTPAGVTPTTTPSPPGTPVASMTPVTPAGLYGDATCDGAVNAIDAAIVLQFGAGLLGAIPCAILADVNQDGVTNAIDAAIILQYTAGLINTLPV